MRSWKKPVTLSSPVLAKALGEGNPTLELRNALSLS